MIKKTYCIYFFLLFLVTNALHANVESFIVVKVDNQIITNYEIKNKILSTLIISGKEITQKNIDSLKKESLASLINSKLKFIEVSKFNLTVSDNQINQYLNSISSNNIQLLKDKFKINELDFDLFLKEVETEFKWQKLIYEIYSNKIEIDPNQIQSELKNFIKKNKAIKEYNLSEIEILLEDNKNVEDKIDMIKKKINDIGFDQVALNFSISSTASKKGLIGWINSKALSKDIFNVLNQMKTNDISKAIKRQNSLLFLKINDIRTIGIKEKEISNLQKDIINQKKNELFNLYSKSHLSKIKNNSFVEYK